MRLNQESALKVFLLCLSFVAAILFLFANTTLPQFGDGAAYSYYGILIAKGKLPFLDFIENKPPGIYYLLSIPARIFGWNILPAILLMRAVDLLNFILFWRLSNFFSQNRIFKLLGIFSFILAYYQLFPAGYEGVYVEPVQMLFVQYAYLKYLKKEKLFLVAALISLATIFRQVAPLELLLFLGLIVTSSQSISNKFSKSFEIALGFIAPLLIFVLIAFWQNWLAAMWKYVFTWNMHYSLSSGSAYSRALPIIKESVLLPGLSLIVLCSLLFIFLFIRNLFSRKNTELEKFLLFSLIVNFIQIWPATYRFYHHFLPWTVSLSLILVYSLNKFSPKLLSFIQAPLIFVQTCILILFCFEFYNNSRQVDEKNEILKRVAEWTKQNTNENDYILAWGFRPELYLLAERHTASVFSHYYMLTNYAESFMPLDQEDRWRFDLDIRTNLPKYIFNYAKIDICKYSEFVCENYSRKNLRLGDVSQEYFVIGQGNL